MARIDAPSSPLLHAAMRALSRFFAWWQAELSTLIPTGLRLWWRESDNLVMLSFQGTRAVFARPAGARCEQIHAVDLGTSAPSLHRAETGRHLLQAAGSNFRLLLCLPPEQVLQRSLTLPLAVEENLRQTLVFELDRLTPFRPEQVYFDFRILDRDAANKHLSVALAVVRKSIVDEGAVRAASLGLTLNGAVLSDEVLNNGGGWRNFLPAAPGPRHPSARPRWRAGFALLSAVLLVILLAVPPWQKRAAAISLIPPLARAKAEAEETNALRERLGKLVEEHNFLHDRKWGTPSAVLVLEELSKLLPDDTFVMSLTFDGKTVQILGETASSTALVETLEASPLFKDVSFKEQLTKIPGTPYDRFHLSGTLKAAAKPAPPAPPSAQSGSVAGPASPAIPANTQATGDSSPKLPAVNPGGKP